MKTFLAAAAVVTLSAGSAFAACGHDMVQSKKSDSVASVDMSTTASTTKTDEAKPADAVKVETE